MRNNDMLLNAAKVLIVLVAIGFGVAIKSQNASRPTLPLGELKTSNALLVQANVATVHGQDYAVRINPGMNGRQVREILNLVSFGEGTTDADIDRGQEVLVVLQNPDGSSIQIHFYENKVLASRYFDAGATAENNKVLQAR